MSGHGMGKSGQSMEHQGMGTSTALSMDSTLQAPNGLLRTVSAIYGAEPRMPT